MKYLQSFYQYPVTFSSIGKTIPARSAQGDLKNIAEISEAELEKLQNREPFFRELVDKKKLRVLNHLPESYKTSASRINEANDEIARLKAENERLKAMQNAPAPQPAETTEEKSSDVEADTENKAEDLKALSYDDLKAKATELGIEYKANVKKADLIKLIEDALTKAE